MEHIYRGFRISIREADNGWHARFWRVSGTPVTIKASATQEEGSAVCLERAAMAVDAFIAYVQSPSRK